METRPVNLNAVSLGLKEAFRFGELSENI